MAIDRNATESLINEINSLFDMIPVVDEKTKALVKKMVMGPVIQEIEKLIQDSRSPRLLIFGRSGHGKSSLINALCNKKVADAEEPTHPNTAKATSYKVLFTDKFSSWDIIDTRGIFETTTASGSEGINAEDALLKAISTYKPDVIMHVIAAKEVRTLQNDLIFYSHMEKEILKLNNDRMIPTVVCLNQVDVYGCKQWPPEEHPKKAGEIMELMEYFCNEVIKTSYSKIDKNNDLKGFRLEYSDINPYISVIPVCCFWDDDNDDRWNIDTLYNYIGEKLPLEAQLDYFQALGRHDSLKKLSTSLIKRFSSIALAIGANPIPFSDIAILVPLQLIMISIIGGLSCRSLSMDTAKEYLAAAGIDLAGGFIAKQLFRQLVKFLPGPGTVVSGAVAATTTYGIGKAAETYFFSGVITDPNGFTFSAD